MHDDVKAPIEAKNAEEMWKSGAALPRDIIDNSVKETLRCCCWSVACAPAAAE